MLLGYKTIQCLCIVVNVHFCGFYAAVRGLALAPAARNNPNIVRRDPGLPPSTVDQDYPFEDPTGKICYV